MLHGTGLVISRAGGVMPYSIFLRILLAVAVPALIDAGLALLGRRTPPHSGGAS